MPDMTVPVTVTENQRFDSWAYSDYDKAVLVSFVFIGPEKDVREALADLDVARQTFSLDVYTGTSHSTQLVSCVDLGED